MRTRTWLRCRRRKVEEEKKSEKWLWWGQFLWRWWWITAFSQKSTHESCNPKVTNIALGKTGIAFLADDWTVAFKLRGSGRILQGSQSVVLKGPTWSQQSLVKSWADVFVFLCCVFFLVKFTAAITLAALCRLQKHTSTRLNLDAIQRRTAGVSRVIKKWWRWGSRVVVRKSLPVCMWSWKCVRVWESECVTARGNQGRRAFSTEHCTVLQEWRYHTELQFATPLQHCEMGAASEWWGGWWPGSLLGPQLPKR